MFHLRILSLILLSMALTACLAPDRYHANLSLSNTAYSLEFIGEMHIMAAYSPLYQKSTNSPQELALKVMHEFERVIKERQQVKLETRLVSPTLFQTAFVYVSPYDDPEATGLFRLEVEGDVLRVTSRAISFKEHQMLRDNKITSRGKLCIKAFGTVLSTNAHSTATLLDRCNYWNLDNLDEPISLVVRFPKTIPLRKALH